MGVMGYCTPRVKLHAVQHFGYDLTFGGTRNHCMDERARARFASSVFSCVLHEGWSETLSQIITTHWRNHKQMYN